MVAPDLIRPREDPSTPSFVHLQSVQIAPLPESLLVDPPGPPVHLPDLCLFATADAGRLPDIERRGGDRPLFHALQLSVTGYPDLALRDHQAQCVAGFPAPDR